MKGNTQLRQESIKRVLTEIRRNGPVSKRELQNATGFSWGNISSVTNLLYNEKYIMPSGKQETFVGRKPEEFDININDNFIIGIDFNSEGVLVALCDLKGRVVKKYTSGFAQKNRQVALDTLFSLVETAINENCEKNICHIALAMQGDVDTSSGISVCISAIDGWYNVPVCEMLESRFGKKTLLLHDPDCLLYTENYYGNLNESGAENAVLLRIDHGIGIACMLGGKMYMGVKGKTCEIGTVVVPQPQNGWAMLRDIISENTVSAEYKKLSGLDKSCGQIAETARIGDESAALIFRNLGKALGFAINNAISLLNPEQVILFGAFTEYSDLFLSATQSVISNLFGEGTPKLILSALDNDAAAVGAALFAADRYIAGLEFEG